jgi:hypothetical protein
MDVLDDPLLHGAFRSRGPRDRSHHRRQRRVARIEGPVPKPVCQPLRGIELLLWHRLPVAPPRLPGGHRRFFPGCAVRGPHGRGPGFQDARAAARLRSRTGSEAGARSAVGRHRPERLLLHLESLPPFSCCAPRGPLEFCGVPQAPLRKAQDSPWCSKPLQAEGRRRVYVRSTDLKPLRDLLMAAAAVQLPRAWMA